MSGDTVLPDRGREGYTVYAKGMEASAGEKARLLGWVRPGTIADLGSGTGTVLALLSRAFPESRLVGVDLSDEMLARARERFPEVELRQADIASRLFPEASVDTVLLSSIMHEVFSYKGYDYTPVRTTLAEAHRALVEGGRIIIRDGPKPEVQEVVYLTFKNERARAKFERFSREFGSSEIVWRIVDGRVQVARRDAFEFLSKYIYDANWDHEVKEHFGVFTLAEWQAELARAGFAVVHAESYLIEWLKLTHYEKDLTLEVRTGEGYAPGEWPHSTMILVGEKRG